MKKLIRKFYRKGVAAVLISVLMVLGAITSSLADTIKKDGFEVTITTDKEAYKAGEEIKISVAVKNTGQKKIDNVMIELQIPEGVQLSDESSASITINSIKASEEKIEEVTATAKKDVNTGDNDNTGDNWH